MKRSVVWTLVVCTVLVMCWAGTAFGQVTSRVTGIVTDKTGAVVSGADVTLTNEATNVAFTTTTTTTGSYVFDGVQPGTYAVKVVMKGFKTFTSPGNVVTIGQPRAVNAALEVGATGETVEVRGGTELVQTATSGNIGTLVDQVAVTTLPIVGTRGRNPLELVELQPGVVDAGGFNQSGPNVQGGGVHVNGARDRAWNYTLDGIDINETSAGGSNFSPLRTNPDMLAEFRVVTSSFTSEYGRSSGAQVEMVTKSGTNQFHGTGFFFYQTPALMANDPGNKAYGVPRPQWVQKIPGFSFGGPIQKNKTFFFTNFQWLRTLKTVPETLTVYTQQARNGVFRYVTSGHNLPAGRTGSSVDASGNVLPGVNVATYDVVANDPQGTGIDPTVKSVLGLTPLPNDFYTGDGLNTAGFKWNAAEHEKQLDMVVKIDHVFNDKHMVYGRWAQGHQNTYCDTVNAGLAPFPGVPCTVDTFRKPNNFAFNWRWTISPTVLNELVLGGSHFAFSFVNGDPNYKTEPGWWFNNVTMPVGNWSYNARALTTYQLVDNMSWAKGAHTFKWGINFRYLRHIDSRGSIGNLGEWPSMDLGADISSDPASASYFAVPAADPTYDLPTWRGFVNDLLGRVGNLSQGYVAKNDSTWNPIWTPLRADFRMPQYDSYIQDSWKMKPNLTVDIGLRWEIRPSPSVPDSSRMLHPDQSFVWGKTPTDTLKWVPGSLYKNSSRNFAPSIGFAWDPFNTGKMSVRGNYRGAYDVINTFSLSSALFQGFPGLTYNSYAFPNASTDPNDYIAYRVSQLTNSVINQLTAPPDTPGMLHQPPAYGYDNGITVIDPNWRPPLTHMWSLGIQRQLTKDMGLEVNYLGRRATHLYGAYDGNQVEMISNGFLQAFNTVKAGNDSPLIDQLLEADSRFPGGMTGSQWLRDPNSPYYSAYNMGSVASVAYALATRWNMNLPQQAGLSPFFFLSFPQFGGGFTVLDSNDFSTYHALQSILRRNFANGLTFQLAYTWSKSLDTRSYDPTFSTVAWGSSPWGSSSTPFDLHDRKLNYAPSDFDRTHSVQATWYYELPFGRGKRFGGGLPGYLERFIGGWELAGFAILQSGRPTTIFSPAYTLSQIVRTPASCTGCDPHMFSVHRDQGGNWNYLTPTQMDMFSTPGPGEFSNVGRNFFRLAGYKNLSMSIGKKTRIREGHQLEMRLEIQNVTNSMQFDEPASNRSDNPYGTFGSLNPSDLSDAGRALSSDPRKMQLSVKYIF